MTSIGFHAGPAGNHNGIGDYMAQLHAAGIPLFVKAVDDYSKCFAAVNIAKTGGVPHTIVFRLSTAGQNDGLQYDVPPYHMTPHDAAVFHWTITKNKLPPEFDKSLVWIEPINEVDKNRADWLGHFAAEIGALATSQGYKVALFGWSSGEPEPEHWQAAGMRRYLEMCAANPGKLAVSLHEYSYSQDITSDHPWLVGRFTKLFDACAIMGIGRPTVLITEFGWEHNDVPEPAAAMTGLDWAYHVYLPYPEVKGVAIWYLGGGYGDIHNQVQKLIAPVTTYMLNTPGGSPPPPGPPPIPPGNENLLPNPSFELGWWHINGIPELQIANSFEIEYKEGEMSPGGWAYVRPEYRVLPAAYLPPAEQPLFILDGTHTIKVFKGSGAINTVYKSQPFDLDPGRYRLTIPLYPDAVMDYAGGQKVFANPGSADYRVWIDGVQGDWIDPHPYGEWRELVHEFEVETAGPVRVGVRLRNIYALNNSGWFTDMWRLERVDETPPPPPPPAVFRAQAWPTTTLRVNQWFAANPQNYQQFGLPGHDGQDGRALTGDPIKAIAAGTVYLAGTSNDSPNYGIQVRIAHSDGHKSVYAHLQGVKVSVEQVVTAGQLVGLADNTGNSFGSHLHLGYKRAGQTYTDPAGNVWPFNLFDPWLALAPLYEDYLATAGATGWAWAAGMLKHPHFPAVSWAYGNNVNLNLRRTPDSSQPPIGVIPAGVPFRITGAIQGGYYPVRALLRSTPPVGVDMGKYLLPASGDYGRVFTLSNNWGGGQEQVQIQRSGNLSFVVKNSQWERRLIGEEYIDLQLDTSPGDGQYYTVAGHWLPRRMDVGQVFTRTEWVSFKQKDNCQPVPDKPPYASTTQIVFEKHMPTWASQGGVTLNDVVVLAWLVNGNIDERYVYAAGLGLVTWQKWDGKVSWISEMLPPGTPNLSREGGCFAS